MTSEGEGALAALTVLDLSQGIAGPYAASLFAEHGATVIKVEGPAVGDVARSWAGGAAFLALNAGKLSLKLDYETQEGAAVLRRLAEEADAIIEDHPARRRDELGLSAGELIGRAPRLVICQVSGFGSSGPYAGRPLTTLTLAAASGLLPDEPTPAYNRPLEQVAGMHAYLATLAALWHAAQTERGQVVEVSLFEALIATAGGPLAEALSGVSGGTLAEGAGTPVDAARLRAAGLIREIDGRAYPLAPFAFARTAARAPGRVPRLGEHSDYVLKDLMGLDAGEVDALRAKGIV